MIRKCSSKISGVTIRGNNLLLRTRFSSLVSLITFDSQLQAKQREKDIMNEKSLTNYNSHHYLNYLSLSIVFLIIEAWPTYFYQPCLLHTNIQTCEILIDWSLPRPYYTSKICSTRCKHNIYNTQKIWKELLFILEVMIISLRMRLLLDCKKKKKKKKAAFKLLQPTLLLFPFCVTILLNGELCSAMLRRTPRQSYFCIYERSGKRVCNWFPIDWWLYLVPTVLWFLHLCFQCNESKHKKYHYNDSL